MKYSLPFYTTNPHLNTVDEIMIKYDADSEPSLIDFLDEHKNQRVILRISKNNKMKSDNYHFLQSIVQNYPKGNVIIRFDELNSIGKEYALPHFFNYYCTDKEQARVLDKQGVTDIYITGNLCYQLVDLREEIKCNIRVFPNIAQSSIETSNSYTKFFIRPEDIKIYEKYIDYIEFYTDDVKRAAGLYNIYCIQGKYEGALEEVIDGLPAFIAHNECIDPLFALERLRCRKACAYWSNCKLCEHWFNLAQTLYNKKYTIKLSDKGSD